MRRRILASAGSKPLPYDAEVEYLESSGTQYIDTNFIPNRDDVRIVCDVQRRSTDDMMVFGIYNRFVRWLHLDLVYNANIRFCGNSISYPLPGEATSRYLFEVGLVSKIDGVEITQFGVIHTLSVNSGDKMCLFNRFESDGISVSPYPFKGCIFMFSVYYASELMLDFIPVRFTNENGESEGAMFDQAGSGGMNPDGTPRTDGLYRNRGTGAFGWKDKNGVYVPPT